MKENSKIISGIAINIPIKTYITLPNPYNPQFKTAYFQERKDSEREREKWRRDLRSCLVHGIEIAIAAVIEGERVVSVGPDGGDGGVAALRDDAAEGP